MCFYGFFLQTLEDICILTTSITRQSILNILLAFKCALFSDSHRSTKVRLGERHVLFAKIWGIHFKTKPSALALPRDVFLVALHALGLKTLERGSAHPDGVRCGPITSYPDFRDSV